MIIFLHQEEKVAQLGLKTGLNGQEKLLNCGWIKAFLGAKRATFQIETNEAENV